MNRALWHMRAAGLMTTEPTSTSSLKRPIIRQPLVAYVAAAFAGYRSSSAPLLLSQDGFSLVPSSCPCRALSTSSSGGIEL